MGVLPLQFLDGDDADSLGLTGTEVLDMSGLAEALERRGGPATVTVSADGHPFRARVRLDTAREADHFRHGGIMPFVVRDLLGMAPVAPAS